MRHLAFEELTMFLIPARQLACFIADITLAKHLEPRIASENENRFEFDVPNGDVLAVTIYPERAELWSAKGGTFGVTSKDVLAMLASVAIYFAAHDDSVSACGDSIGLGGENYAALVAWMDRRQFDWQIGYQRDPALDSQ